MTHDQSHTPADLEKNGYRVDAPNALLPASAMGYPVADGMEAEEVGGIDASQLLHALRRRWLPAFSIGIVLAAAAAVGVWFVQVPDYTARAMLRISSNEGSLLNADGKNGGNFEIYKLTHRQLLRGPFVINAALRDPEISALPMIRDQVDPVGWLQSHLSVSFPDNAEIMEVKLSGEKPEAVAKVVNSVVQAYMDEVVDAENNQRRARLSNLERAYSETENDLRSKRTELRRLADTLGTGDTASLSLVQQNALQQFAALRNELTKVQLDLLRSKNRLAIMQSSPQATSDTEVPLDVEEVPDNDGEKNDTDLQATSEEPLDFELENVLASDEITAELKAEVMILEQKISTIEQTAAPAVRERFVGKYEEQIAQFKDHIAKRKEQIQANMAEWKIASSAANIENLKSEIAIQEQMQKQLRADVDGFEKEAKQFGRSSIDVEMMRTEIASLEGVLTRLGNEIENTKIELKSDSRVTFFQEAQPPRSKNARSYAKVGMAGFFGLMLPIAGFIWWDVRSQKINSPSDVSRNLRMNVIGAIPLVPRGILTRSKRNSTKQLYWKSLIAESVGGIVARLFRKSGRSECRAVMVSSALAGEGKTTLAGQIAYALAEAGTRTIIVDFDLRRPALDISFDVELTPGVTELLSGNVEFEDAIQKTGHPNLDIIAAGDWEHNSLRELTGDRMEALFKSLRAEYDYVVVDGSPILPVVDARLIGQYVDGVVLAVLRDVSRAAKVQAARDLLNVFNIPFLGAVVVGTTREDVYNYTSPRTRQKRLVQMN